MKMLLSPVSEKCSASYIDLMKQIQTLPENLESRLMNDLVYDQIFVYKFLKLLSAVHPEDDFVFQINSFVQDYTLRKLLEIGIPLEIVCVNYDVEKYFSGDCYLGLYKRLKKEKFPVMLSEDCASLKCVSQVNTDEILYTLLCLEREVKDMGLSELIKSASEDLRKKSNVSKSDGELTRAMKDMGLDLETGETFMNPPQQPKAETKNTLKKENKKVQKNKPKPQVSTSKATTADSSDDENDICYKVSDGKFVVLIPEDTPIEVVELNGVKFKRILTDLPDLNTDELQVKRVLNTQENKQPQIVRVPIFLKKSEPVTKSSSEDFGEYPELEELRARKQELDIEIAKARKDGDVALVNELRKQRRKVRNTINKLSQED